MQSSDATEIMAAFGTEKVNAALREDWKFLAVTMDWLQFELLLYLHWPGRAR